MRLTFSLAISPHCRDGAGARQSDPRFRSCNNIENIKATAVFSRHAGASSLLHVLCMPSAGCKAMCGCEALRGLGLTWVIQPTDRATANSTVNMLTGMPSAVRTIPV